MNPKFVLYMLLPLAAIVLSIFLVLSGDAVSYAVAGFLFAVGTCLIFGLFLFIPHSYIIDRDGIKVFYRINSCNYVPWAEISDITTRFDTFYENLFFWKDYVISHKNMKRCGRAVDTVTKTKRTTALIEKYWKKGIDTISFK